MDDVLINKAAIIERCLERIAQEYADSADNLTTNFTKQDSIILNLQRTCEAAIDMATRIIRIRKLGVPQSSRDVFVLLENAKLIPAALSQKLQAMVGFRNIAVHNYTALNIEIVHNILKNELTVFLDLNRYLLKIDEDQK